MTAIVVRSDAAHLPLPDSSVDLIVTSPPYFALRSYQDGGQHYAHQIGSEPTPQEFLEALWTCTAEWMRVLKPGGSMFVNLGDAFSKAQRFDDEFTVEDAAWLAGVIDSDGSISVHKQGTSYTAWMRVGQVRSEVVQRIERVTGTGTVCQDARGVWNWQAAAQQARWVLERIWPWLHIKRRPALAAVELQGRKASVGGKGRWNALTDGELRHRERIRQAVLAWNRGDQDDYDPPLLPLPDLPMSARWIKQKSLMLLPERYRIGCVDRLGLIARAVIVWDKPNGLPESVTDRVRRSHEDWVHLTLAPRYFSAIDEIREPHAQPWRSGRSDSFGKNPHRKDDAARMAGDYAQLGKLPGSVWTVATEPLNVPDHLGVDHFAAFPTEWPRRIIQGWSPAGICTACQEGRRPVAEREASGRIATTARGGGNSRENGYADFSHINRSQWQENVTRTITGYACACPAPDQPIRPAVVLDPFGGTGTTALCASILGRIGISIDLSHDYSRLAQWRTQDPGQRAKAMRVEKPPVQLDGQADLFGGEAA